MTGPLSAQTSKNRIHSSTKRRLFEEYRTKRSRDEAIFAFVLLIPTIVILAFVVFYPLIQAIVLSFQNVNLMNVSMTTPAGLANFKHLIHDPTFWQALENTIVYVFASVIFGLLIGLSLALVLNEKMPFRAFFRGLALIPWVVPGVVVALLFLYMFNSQAGVIDWVLVKLGLTTGFVQWFGSTHNALWAEIIANIWNQTPFYMLMILAGLQTVPDDQHEAAKIDGASAIARFRYVTLPNIRGVLLVVTSLMVIWNFNSFDTIWATTQGGPVNATTTLSIYVYRTAFNGLNLGYASAIGVAWLIVLLIFSVFYIRAVEGEKH
jgi:multiple sugar transport system permease protein